VIVTTDPRYYETSVDPENELLLPARLEVIRTPALSAKFTRRIGIGDLGMRSLWHNWQALVRLCRQRSVDLVFIPVPPNPSMVLGRWAKNRFGIPYVVDYIDPVVTEYYWKLPRAQRPPKWVFAYGMARALEPYALRHVSHLIGVDKSYTADVFRRCPWLSETDTTGIPYGGEPSDFEYVRSHPRPNPVFDSNDGCLHMSYVGRGGPDMIPALRAVFQAVRTGMERAPGLFKAMRMHFVGTTYAANSVGRYQVLPLAKEMGLADFVEEHPGRVSYLDAIRILLASHGLLVVGSESAHYTASKIFPYILAQRPILAVFHEASSVVSILRDTRAGEVVTFRNPTSLQARIPELAAHLEGILRLPRGFRPAARWDAFEPYSARSMTARLAQVFDRAASAAERTNGART
jgi:hypothetical protein